MVDRLSQKQTSAVESVKCDLPEAPRTAYSIQRIIKSVIVFAIAGVLLYGVAGLASNFTGIVNSLITFPVKYLFIVVLLVFIGWTIRAWRFHFYLHKCGYNVSFLYSTATFLSGFALTGTPGKIGEAVKGVFLREDYDVPFTETVGIVMIERLMDLWGVLLLSSFSILLFEGWTSAFILCAVTVILGGTFLSTERLYRPVLERLGSVTFLSWISSRLLCTLLTGKNLMTVRIFLIGLISSTLSWGMESLAMYFVLQGFGFTTGILEANFVYSFSTLIGALSMLPGGIGGTEAGMIGLMQVVGISYESGLPAVILIRLCTLWMAVFVGSVVIFGMLSRKSGRAGDILTNANSGPRS